MISSSRLLVNTPLRILFVLLCLCIIRVTTVERVYAQSTRHILVLNSYHAHFLWTEAILSGIQSVLDQPGQNLQIHVEYMDTKRYAPDRIFPHLLNLFKEKYASLSMDAIITSDNNAFDFILAHRDELFPQTPLIFCGVNNFDDSLIAGQHDITGIVEASDIIGTLELAFRFQPNTRRIVVIDNQIRTEPIIAQRFEKDIIPHFSQKIAFEFISDFSMNELKRKMQTISSDSIVFLSAFFGDRDGRYISEEEARQWVALNSPVPVYTCMDFYMGDGVMGGVLTSGFEQGRIAARKALRILQGEKAEDIPIQHNCPTVCTIDYFALKRFGVPATLIPPGGVLINQPPPPFLIKHLRFIAVVFSIIFLLFSLVVFLIITIVHRRKTEKELRESESRFRTLAETSSVATFIHQGAQFCYVNSWMVELCDYEREELLNMNFWDFVHPDYRERIRELGLARLQGDEPPARYETVVLMKRNEIRWIDLSVCTCTYEGKRSILGTFFDITDRKQTQKALEERERLYRSAIEVAGAVPYYFNFDTGEYDFVGSGIKSLTGYSPLEFNARIWRSLERECILQGDPSDLIPQESSVKTRPGERINWRADYRIQTRTNEEKWITNAAVLVRDHQGNTIGSLGTLQDITERKQVEMALRESHEMIRAFIDSSQDWIWSIDEKGIHTYCNPAVESILGYKPDELVGQTCMDLVHEEDRKIVGEKLTQWINEKIGWTNLLIRWRHKDGTWRYLESSAVPILDVNEDLCGFRGIDRDVTKRIRVEDELLKARKMESIGILAGGIAHDFNNLLTAILGNISLAKTYAEPSDPIFLRLEEAEKASLRSQELTQQFLTFSKGGAPIKKTSDIKEMIRDTATFSLRGSNVCCSFDFAPNLWLVNVDEGQMSQVIQNLVINANQAMPEGGMIAIQVENLPAEGTNQAQDTFPKSGDSIRITICDKGMGIPEEHMQKIFDPYFTTKPQGSGLGLATVYSIIKNHEGTISIESKLGEGTCVSVTLPAVEQKITPPIEKQPKKAIQGQGRILVMDDEEIVRDVLGQMLEIIGYEIDFATEGAEAIQKYEQAKATDYPFDVVIMDLTIPGGMSGKEAIQQLQQLDPHIKAIVSSGYSGDPIMSNYQNFGFCGVLRKPYRMEELGEIVHQAFHGSIQSV